MTAQNYCGIDSLSRNYLKQQNTINPVVWINTDIIHLQVNISCALQPKIRN